MALHTYNMAKFKTSATSGNVLQHQEFSFAAGGDANCMATLESSLAGSAEAKHNPAQDSAIAFLGFYPNALKIYVHTKSYTGIFIGASFTVARMRKQSRCPSIGDQIIRLECRDRAVIP